jgi:ABC-2 type transport system permease protein
MPTLTILLKTSWQGWSNSLQHAAENRRRRIIETLGFSVLVTALYLTGQSVFNQLRDVDTATVLKATNLMMGFGVFILAKDAMEGSLKRLYEAPDTPLLLSMPVSPATIFGFKLLQLIAANLLNMFIWLIPPWVAFGQLFRLPWHFYLALFLSCVCLLIIIMSQIAIGMMILVRFFSSRRMIQFLKILGMIVGVAAGLFLSMSLFAIDRSEKTAQFLIKLANDAPAFDWFPHIWAAKLLISWLPNADIEIGRSAVQLIGASVAVPVIGVMLASKIYYRSWEHARRVERSAAPRRKRFVGFAPVGRGRLRSMMAKDFLVFIRHRGRVMMIVMLTLIILIAVIKSTHDMRSQNVSNVASLAGDWDADFAVFVLGIQVMIYSIMATLGLTYSGFKAEEKTWWMLKSGPVTPELLFNSKFLIATLCAVVYTDLWMVVGLNFFRISLESWLPILSATTLITATASGLNTAIGTLPWVAEIQTVEGAEGKNPILRIMTIFAALILNAILLIGSALVLLKLDLFDDVLSGASGRISLPTAQQFTIAMTLGLMVGVWGISYLLGRRSLRRLLG